MPQVEKMPGFGMNQASECQVSEYASGSEYARISQASECVRIIPEYVLWSLNMSAHAGICVNMPKSVWMAFVLHFPIVIPCLLERVL